MSAARPTPRANLRALRLPPASVNRIDCLIASCASWEAFWAALTSEPTVLPGEAFERLTQLYLQTHPEYRTQLKHVWRMS